MKTSKKIKSFMLSVLSFALLVCLLPSRAANNEPAMKSFAKNVYPGAEVVFYEDDITCNSLSKTMPSAFLISGLPRSDVGILSLGGKVLKEGNIVSADEFPSLLFVPKTKAEFSAEIALVPLSSAENISLGASPVTVTLNFSKNPNSPPVAAELELETYKNMPIELNLSAFDHDSDELSFTVVSQKGDGTLTLENNRLIFTPQKDQTGTFSVQYYASDSHGNTSAPAQAVISISKNRSNFTYVDITDPTKEYYAVRLAEEGVFRGESFGKTNTLLSAPSFSRTEFALLCASALGFAPEENAEISAVGIPSWQTAYIPTAVAAGAFDGTDLSSSVTVRSAAFIALDLIEEKLERDIASDSLRFAVDCGIISAADSPEKELSREEALEFICKTKDVVNGRLLGWKQIS